MPRSLAVALSILLAAIDADTVSAQDAAASRTHTVLRQDFADQDSLAPWWFAATGEAAKRMPKPKLADGKLSLLESWWESTASAALSAPATTPVSEFEVAFTLVMNTGTEGCGLAWLDTEAFCAEGQAPEPASWEAPGLPGCFGVGLDARDPVNRDPFRGSGNVYDRPQHQVSLHWDGMEIVKRRTPVDFRDEQPHAFVVRARFVPGGAEVTVTMDGEPLFTEFFVPRMTPYVGRLAFGARNAETAGDVLLDDVVVRLGEAIDTPPAPLVIEALDHVLNDHRAPRHDALVAFPEDTDGYARILCTLRLDKPETRFDPWDRTAHVWLEPEDGPRVELVRYITPYHRGHEWTVDVSDFRPLLRGPMTVAQECSTQGEGWVVSITFRFYAGRVARRAIALVPLWSGSPEIGNPDRPVGDFYVPHDVAVPEGADGALVRTVVTGHGMFPNTDNAGEFMALGRTLGIDDVRFTNVLWKDDNDLNPCRPQGGTWKYDRAGWAPGDVVAPWRVEVPAECLADGSLHVEYVLDRYVNEGRGRTWAPSHRTESCVVFFADVDD